MARVTDVAQGAGLPVLLLALVACAVHQVLEVLATERDRRDRVRPQLVVAPGPDPIPSVTEALQPLVDDLTRRPLHPVGDELAPSLYVDDEIAATVRRVHMDGAL